MRPFTPFPSEDAVARIGQGLIARTLPKAEWTHAGHFAATVWILARRPDIDAPRDMPALIRAYNEATGVANTDTGGYHHTITLASIHAARSWLAAHPASPLHEVCNSLMRGPLGDPDWLLAHWSRETLFSVAARRGWADPDKAALKP